MTLYTKCILASKSRRDGLRISVMSRHTLDDGFTPDLRITQESYDQWMPDLAPLPQLIGAYKRGMPWEIFEERYLAHLERREREVRRLAFCSRILNTTLLCIEESADRCHRRLLAEACKRYVPSLKVVHR